MRTRLLICLIIFFSTSHQSPVRAENLRDQIIDLPQDQDTWDNITEPVCGIEHPPTKYPIVLLHGFMGFDKALKVDYFYRIARDYQNRCAMVYTTNVNPLNTIQRRALELVPQIEQILEVTKSEKINIIAHSMGGLDARHLISNLGFQNRVASLTTIGTPHRGTPVPEYVWRHLGKKNFLYKAFEFLIYGATSSGKRGVNEISLNAALWNLTPTYVNKYFNPNTKDAPGVYYQSYAGLTSVTGLTTGDVIDPLLILFQPSFIGFGANDGLVPVSSAKWGEFRGIVRGDHIDLIGQVFGSTSFLFNHRRFYRYLLNDLAHKGF